MKTFYRVLISFFILTGMAVAQSPYATPPQTNSPPTWTPPSFNLPSDLRHFLESADTFTLYSLNSEPDFEHKARSTFRNHAILGQIKVDEGKDRTSLITALASGIAEGGGMADCFNPRHGIRAIKNGETVDFLICFQCGAVYAWSSNGTKWVFPVSRTPAAIFNSVLKRANVPLPAD